MKQMEAASLATEKASLEMEKLMVKTQEELPLTLSAVELAAVQFDRLGFEIRDSSRRFGLTTSSLPLGRSDAEGDGETGAIGSSSSSGVAAAQQAAALQANSGPGAAMQKVSVEVESSLKALEGWRSRLDKLLASTRNVLGGGGGAQDGGAAAAAQGQGSGAPPVGGAQQGAAEAAGKEQQALAAFLSQAGQQISHIDIGAVRWHLHAQLPTKPGSHLPSLHVYRQRARNCGVRSRIAGASPACASPACESPACESPA